MYSCAFERAFGDSRTYWAIEKVDGSIRDAPFAHGPLAYGAAPPIGWTTTRTPLPLLPGCYAFEVDGVRQLYTLTGFRIANDGSVAEADPSPDQDSAISAVIQPE